MKKKLGFVGLDELESSDRLKRLSAVSCFFGFGGMIVALSIACCLLLFTRGVPTLGWIVVLSCLIAGIGGTVGFIGVAVARVLRKFEKRIVELENKTSPDEQQH